MSQPHVLLIGVERIYRDLFTEWCDDREIPLVSTDGMIPSHVAERVGLCVLSISANEETAYDRIRSTFKSLRSTPVVVLLRNPEVELVVRLVRLGISDVLGVTRPPRETVAEAMRHFADNGQSHDPDSFIGQTPRVRELRATLQRAGNSRSTVLIEGETGTGKGVLARQIHRMSDLRDRPFVHVDCAALSPTLIESELFGHERGAFTGADSMRRGRFETAADGTIFLDEIGDLDGPLQTKLLRVLGDRLFERVGGTQPMPMQARVIAATSRELLKEVSAKRFRADLYFRLNVLHFQIPPLRERLDDIPLLAQAGLMRLTDSLGIPMPRVSGDFYDHLTDFTWPGNVRELMNVLERVLVNRRADDLLPEDLEGFLQQSTPSTRPGAEDADGEPLDEAGVILAAIRDTGGNIARAARRLDIARGTLRYRIKKFGLEDLVPKD